MGKTVKHLWTIGYSGKELDSMLRLLADAGVEVLVDVRWNPLSRKKGFSKSALWAAAMEAGIEYRHFRDLGAPGDLRDELSASSDFVAFSKSYRSHLSTQQEPLAQLEELASSRAVCVLCVEEQPEDCHRGILAEELRTAGFEAIHLGVV